MLPAIANGLGTVYAALPEEQRKKASTWVRKATGNAVATSQKLISYAGSSEGTAAVVAEGLVRAGAPVQKVAELFDGTANATQIRRSIIALGQSLLATEDSSRPGLNASVSDTASDVLRADLCKVLVRAFGSIDNARKVQMGLATLRAEDFDWYRSLFLGQPR